VASSDYMPGRGCLVVLLFAMSALMLLMAILPDTDTMQTVEGGRLVFFLVAVGAGAIAVVIRRHGKAAEARERDKSMRRVASRAEYYRGYLSANAMVGTYKGGHPGICRETLVLIEITPDAVKITPAVLTDGTPGWSTKTPHMDDPQFKARWDWDLSVSIPFERIEFIQSQSSSTVITQERDPVARAIVGGAVAGETGALVGAVSGLKDRKVSFASKYLHIKFREPDATETYTFVTSIHDNYQNIRSQGLEGLSLDTPDMKDYLAGFTPFVKRLQMVHDECRRGRRQRD
jgi:hypothetical protein